MSCEAPLTTVTIVLKIPVTECSSWLRTSRAGMEFSEGLHCPAMPLRIPLNSGASILNAHIPCCRYNGSLLTFSCESLSAFMSMGEILALLQSMAKLPLNK